MCSRAFTDGKFAECVKRAGPDVVQRFIRQCEMDLCASGQKVEL